MADVALVSGGGGDQPSKSPPPLCPNYPVEGECRLPSGTIVRDGYIVDDGSLAEARRNHESATKGLVFGAIGGLFSGSLLGVAFGAAGGFAGGAGSDMVEIQDDEPPEDRKEKYC